MNKRLFLALSPLVFLLAACSTPTATDAGSTPAPTPTASASPSVEPTPEPSAVEESPEEDTALATTVQGQIESAFTDGITSDSPLFPVTEYEDMGAGTLRVYVQDALLDEGRVQVAQHVFNLGAWDNTDLRTLVVRDVSGLDSNHYRTDFSYLPQ